MADDGHPKLEPMKRPPFEAIVLLLQGGGALGAYQAGVYEALAEAGMHPDWIAGISIGAINSALIAGNAPQERVAKLRAFWEQTTATAPWNFLSDHVTRLARGDDARLFVNQTNAFLNLMGGAPGFFTPRVPGPWQQPRGTMEATSYYDNSALKTTLERLVDFDRLNSGGMRLSCGTVNVRTGNFVYFDTKTHRIKPEHIIASGSLPPGFPATEIDGEYYWDGGLVSNTPLQWVLQYGPRQDTLAFQVDLWPARGEFPASISEVATRQKEILYSSRTRENTERFRASQKMRHAFAKMCEFIPEAAKQTPEYEYLHSMADSKVYSIVELIYRAHQYEGDNKDYEFSRASMEEHWRTGYTDAARTLHHPKSLARPSDVDGLALFDIHDHD